MAKIVNFMLHILPELNFLKEYFFKKEKKKKNLFPKLSPSGGGHGKPLQYSYLENSMDRGAWWATVHQITKSWT